MSDQSRSGERAPITAVARISPRTVAAAPALGGSTAFAGAVERSDGVQIGLTPVRHFFHTYGHRNVVRAVTAQLAQSGSVDGCVWDVLQETEPDLTRHTGMLPKSELLGLPPIAAPGRQSKLPPKDELASALLDMPRHADGEHVLAAPRRDGFAAGDAALFHTTAAKAEHVRRADETALY